MAWMRRALHRPAIAGLLLGFAPAIGWAEEEKGGLPQLDVHSYSSQLFWLAVFSVLVYCFMRFVGIPRVVAILEERRAQIGGDLSAAERARIEADAARKAYEATMAEAHAKARQLLAETQEQSVAQRTEATRAAAARLDGRVDDAVQRIETVRSDAMQGIRDVVRGLATDITIRLADRTPAPESVARAVDDASGREAA
jgi:F-type H+-transporting ATPase subunit b